MTVFFKLLIEINHKNSQEKDIIWTKDATSYYNRFDIIIFSICARSRLDPCISMRMPSELALTEKWLIYNLLKKIRD